MFCMSLEDGSYSTDSLMRLVVVKPLYPVFLKLVFPIITNQGIIVMHTFICISMSISMCTSMCTLMTFISSLGSPKDPSDDAPLNTSKHPYIHFYTSTSIYTSIDIFSCTIMCTSLYISKWITMYTHINMHPMHTSDHPDFWHVTVCIKFWGLLAPSSRIHELADS